MNADIMDAGMRRIGEDIEHRSHQMSPIPASHSSSCHIWTKHARSNIGWPSPKLGMEQEVNPFSFLPVLCNCFFSFFQIFRFPSDPITPPSSSYLQMKCSVSEKSRCEVIGLPRAMFHNAVMRAHPLRSQAGHHCVYFVYPAYDTGVFLIYSS